MGPYIIDNIGSKYEIRSLIIEAKYRKEKYIVGLEHTSYSHSRVSYGTGNTFGRRLAIAFVEPPGKDATLGISIREVKDKC